MKVGDNMEIYKGYYSNKNINLFTILKTLKIVKPIFDEYEVNRVLLFGSYARNEASLISDIDFCIIDPKIKSLKLFTLKGDLQKHYLKILIFFSYLLLKLIHQYTKIFLVKE